MDETNNTIKEVLNRPVEALFGNGKHQKNLIRNCKKLLDVVAKEEKISNKEQLWRTFIKWCHDNKEKATKYADAVLREFMEEKKGIQKIRQYVNMHLTAWKRIGVQVSSKLQGEIEQLSCTIWKQSQEQIRAKQDAKEGQLKELSSKLVPLQKHFLEYTPEKFREAAKEALSNENLGVGVKEDLQSFLNKNKKNNEFIFAIILKANAAIGLGKQLGTRFGHFSFLPNENWVVEQDYEGIFVKYDNYKSGTKQNVARKCISRLVPCKEIEDDGIVKLALYVYFLIVICDQLPTHPFLFGFKASQDKENTVNQIRRQITAVIEAIGVHSGVLPTGFRIEGCPRKLHVFRSMCTNILVDMNASSKEIDEHLDWEKTVQNQYYALAEKKVKASRTPFLLALRENKETPPHPMWNYVDKVPQSLLPANLPANLNYLCRVAITTFTTGQGIPEHYNTYLENTLFKKKEFVEFKRLVNNYISVCLQEERKNKKRSFKEVEQELNDLKAELAMYKRQKEGEFESVTLDTFKSYLRDIQKYRTDENFPKLCMDLFVEKLHFAGLILVKEPNTPSLILPLRDTLGKFFREVLRLVFLCRKHPNFLKRDKEGQSWIAWVSKHKDEHPINLSDVSSFTNFCKQNQF